MRYATLLGGERFARGLQIGLALCQLQRSKIVERDDGRNGPAVPCQHHSLVGRRGA